jgi:hypothetical protein
MAGHWSNRLQIIFQLWFRQTLRCSSLVHIFNINFSIKHLFRLTVRYSHAIAKPQRCASAFDPPPGLQIKQLLKRFYTKHLFPNWEIGIFEQNCE